MGRLVFTQNNRVLLKSANLFTAEIGGIGSHWSANGATLDAFDSNLKGYYKFNSGSIGNDSTANGYHLTNSGADEQSSGKSGNCAEFVKANNDYMYRASNPFVFTGQCTIAYWIYFNSQTSDADMIGNSYSGGFDIYNYSTNPTPKVVFYNAGDNGGGGWAWDVTFSNSAWYHLALRRNSSNQLFFYVNGSQIGSYVTTSTTIGNGSNNIQFGKDVTASNWLDGRLDEVGFWNTDIGSSGISALYNGGTGAFWTP